MQTPFTTFAVSRFVDREAVIEALRQYAQRLKVQQPAVVSVYLFGSFANGTATPRSDADLLVEITDAAVVLPDAVREAAISHSAELPVPIDVFVLTAARIADGMQSRRGVAGAVARDGVRLAS